MKISPVVNTYYFLFELGMAPLTNPPRLILSEKWLHTTMYVVSREVIGYSDSYSTASITVRGSLDENVPYVPFYMVTLERYILLYLPTSY